jgi:hypothetical protein
MKSMVQHYSGIPHKTPFGNFSLLSIFVLFLYSLISITSKERYRTGIKRMNPIEK